MFRLTALILSLCYAFAYLPAQPKQNVWITLANMTGQDAICLSMASPSNPFSTCLVGVPDVEWPCPSTVLGLCSTSTYVDNWDGIVPHLPQAPLEPQELEILGSLKADHCVMFNYISVQHSQNFTVTVNATNVYYQNTSNWCNYTSTSIS